MAVWSFVLAPGGDITSLVDIGSIKRHRRLHTELRPNVNRLDFRCRMDGATLQSLMANDVVELTVTRDAVPYFRGVLSPNYTAQIRDGQRYLAIIAEDFTIQRLGQTITTPQAWAGFAVCNPAAPASSLVHVIATAAGVTVASGAPTISATIPYVVVLPDDKATWAKLLEDILFDHQHVYNFNEAGQLTLARAVNAGSISPTATLTSAPGSANLRGELTITKSPEKYDDIRVIYDLVELKTGLVLFQDTTGGNDLTPASIPLAASGDAGGKDYYPLTSKIGEVYSAWNNPDGYDIWVATSAALDATYESGIVISRALTNYYRKASFAFRNTAGAEKKITKLRITGNAYVVASKNTARVSLASARTILEHQARYIFSDAAAQSLANSLAHYYRYADIKYSAKSALALAVGDYVTVADPVYSGISTLCRVVGVLDSPATPGAVYEYELEGAADFAPIPIVTEGESVPGSSPGGFENSAYANSTPPTLNVTNLAFSSEQNPSGMIDVTVSWDYTQGASPADGFLVFYKRDVTTPGDIDIFRDPSVFVQAGGATSYQTILTLPARQAGAGTLPIHYRFGVVAFGTRRSGTVVHLAGVVEHPDWIDKTFASKIQVDGNNYWDQDTGEMRVGSADKYIHVQPQLGRFDIHSVDLELTSAELITNADGTELSHEGHSLVWRNKNTQTEIQRLDGMVKKYTNKYAPVSWAERTISATSRGWRNIVWSSELGIFVMIAHPGLVCATSSDGINWVERETPPPSRYWRSIAWSPQLGIFVITAASGNVCATSPDGINWTLRALPGSTRDWDGVTWSPKLGLFVIVINSSINCATSPDGINWTERTISATLRDWRYVTWSQDREIFVALAIASNICATSPDGINWTERTISATARNWICMAWSPKLMLFVAISYITSICATSPDGINWTERTISATTRNWNSITWSPEREVFIMVASSASICATSPDGINWTERTISASARNWSSIVWSPQLGIFVASCIGATVCATSDQFLDENIWATPGGGIIEKGNDEIGSYYKLFDGALVRVRPETGDAIRAEKIRTSPPVSPVDGDIWMA